MIFGKVWVGATLLKEKMKATKIFGTTFLSGSLDFNLYYSGILDIGGLNIYISEQRINVDYPTL